jgi:hypothetical protein
MLTLSEIWLGFYTVFAKRFAFEPVMVDQMNLHRRFNCEKAKEILGFEYAFFKTLLLPHKT